MSEIERAISDYEAGLRTGGELENALYSACHYGSSESAATLEELAAHENKAVREAAVSVRESLSKIAELETDLDAVRRAAPLRQGVRTRLSGGYSHTNLQPWLDGRECLEGTFRDFCFVGDKTLPAAIIDLDKPVDVTENSGLRHYGQIALVRVLYAGEPWIDRSTVMIHVVDELPTDTALFFASHILGNELESHATIEIASGAEQDAAVQPPALGDLKSE
ncbi:MAG: hypothetical protein AAF357_08560 [Verrucomicrobiota bacterium]